MSASKPISAAPAPVPARDPADDQRQAGQPDQQFDTFINRAMSAKSPAANPGADGPAASDSAPDQMFAACASPAPASSETDDHDSGKPGAPAGRPQLPAGILPFNLAIASQNLPGVVLAPITTTVTGGGGLFTGPQTSGPAGTFGVLVAGLPATGTSQPAGAGEKTGAAAGPAAGAVPGINGNFAKKEEARTTADATPKPAPLADGPQSPVAAVDEKSSGEAKPGPDPAASLQNQPEMKAAKNSEPQNGPAGGPLSAGGISAAQQDSPMKNESKAKEFSGSAEQKLPGESTIAPTASGASTSSTAPTGHAGATAMIAGSHPTTTATGGTGLMDAAPAARPSTALMDQTRELVANQALRLSVSTGDSLRVVIKPDAQTQLSLDLQQDQDGIKVYALLDHGDFGLLNRHWPELQQQLEARGVRLAPLSYLAQNFGGGSQGFQPPTDQNNRHLLEEDAALAGTLAALALGGAPATAAASASASICHGWETWA